QLARLNLRSTGMSYQPHFHIVYGHTGYSGEYSNLRMLEQIKDLEFVSLSNLASRYQDGSVDVAEEQKYLKAADLIIFQFPFYWYSVPHNLKRYMDEVFEHGFAYGSSGNALHGKRFLCAITTGGPEDAYHHEGYNKFEMAELLRPLEQTANLCGMHYMPPFILHSAPNLVAGRMEEHERRVAEHAKAYRDLIERCRWNADLQKDVH
ncbi:NAD(P)H-dependent oxidoreductase, partial [Oleiphilus sp. HI0067]|uniref:NAD(P)H-dependent oxidoreductase n=2 Tax=Oleiphilus TaxID=141450 RepID=UPI001E46D748